MCGAVPIPWDFRDFEKLFVLISFLLDAYVHFELLLDASQTEAATETFLLLKKKNHTVRKVLLVGRKGHWLHGLVFISYLGKKGQLR